MTDMTAYIGLKETSASTTATALFDLALPLWSLPIVRARRRQDLLPKRRGNIAWTKSRAFWSEADTLTTAPSPFLPSPHRFGGYNEE
ncbi:hypothetical protein EVAR_27958_1 [Eumeta japonica]|uniref:Uncharacterized protein n=1 Tax=Eumeta variegata TaxID=151549 RepID=A0A4C1ZV11_EUMVA|nr:hypothetical protein EVAR_27958_1 [Eumeta japonica]